MKKLLLSYGWKLAVTVMALIGLLAGIGVFSGGGTGAIGDPVYQGTTFAVGGVPVIGADGVTVNTTDKATSLNAPTGRGATYVIAASDATALEKAQADLTLLSNYGAGINSKLTALGVGVSVRFFGTFTLETSVLPLSGQTLWARSDATFKADGVTTSLVTLTNVSYAHINGITFDGNSTCNYGIMSNSTNASIPNNALIEHNKFINYVIAGLYTYDTTGQIANGLTASFNNMIGNNTDGTTGSGIIGILSGGVYCTYSSNIILHNDYGVKTIAVGGSANSVFDSNIIGLNYYGVFLSDANPRNQILNNRINHNVTGMWLEGQGHIISNNIIVANSDSSVRIFTGQYLQITNNQIWTSSGGTADIYIMSGTYGDFNIANNEIGALSPSTLAQSIYVFGGLLPFVGAVRNFKNNIIRYSTAAINNPSFLINGSFINNQGYIAPGEIRTASGALTKTGSVLTGLTGTWTETGTPLLPGSNTWHCTVAGTATITLPVGTTGTIASGAATITVPASGLLVAGANAVTCSATGGAFDFNITLNCMGFTWQNPEAQAIIIDECIIDITTSGGTATSVMDVGSAADAVTTSNNLLNNLDLTATTVTVSTARTIKLAANGGATDWITGQIQTEIANNLVGTYTIKYRGQ
jgi:hypothetical protein